MTLAGGCAPEASTLPPVTLSRIFSSYVSVRSHTENQLSMLPGCALQFCVEGWWVAVNLMVDFG